MSDLSTAFGRPPNQVTGEAGSGVLLYLHTMTFERHEEKLLQRHAAERQEVWRKRWAALFAFVAFAATTLSLLDRLGVFHR